MAIERIDTCRRSVNCCKRNPVSCNRMYLLYGIALDLTDSTYRLPCRKRKNVRAELFLQRLGKVSGSWIESGTRHVTGPPPLASG